MKFSLIYLVFGLCFVVKAASTLAVNGKVCQQPVYGQGLPRGTTWFPHCIMLAAVMEVEISWVQCENNNQINK